MSLKHLKFELSEEQLKKRHQDALDLHDEPEVKEFFKKNNLSFELYEENITKFKRWLKSMRQAKAYSYDEVYQDIQKGEFLDLVYDENLDTIFEVIRRLPVVYEIEDELRFLNRYKVFPLAKSLHEAFFQNLDLKKEKANPSYMKILRELRQFIENDESGYYLFGNLGVGKSYLAACVSNQMAKEGKAVAFVHVPSLFNHLKQQFGNNKEQERTLQELRRAKLLVLDDLGAEPITAWGRDEILLSILNDRLENRRKTIITSNYKPEMLNDLYRVDTRGVSDEIRAQRLVDRIKALTKSRQITGINRRHQ